LIAIWTLSLLVTIHLRVGLCCAAAHCQNIIPFW